MKAAMDYKKFLELVGRLESQGDAPREMLPLVALFKEMGLLMGKFSQSQEPEEKEVAWESLLACQQRLKEEFATACGQWGVSAEEATDYIENPMNYSPAEWRKVQEVRTEVYDTIKEEKRSRSQAKRKPRRWV